MKLSYAQRFALRFIDENHGGGWRANFNAIKALLRRGYIEQATPGVHDFYYRITDTGRKALDADRTERWLSH